MLRVGQTLLPLGIVVALGLLVPGRVEGQGGWREPFEGGAPSWRDAGGDVPFRFEVHQRSPQQPHSGSSCEWVQSVAAPNGTTVYLAHPVGRAQLIDELEPSVWVRSDQPGVLFLARVVLPRAIDPATKQAATIVVTGSTLQRVGGWEQLRIEQLPLLVQRQARALRAQWRQEVDIHEAFVDHVLLNIYHPGRRQVWIDDLELAGHVGPPVVLTSGDEVIPPPGTQAGRVEHAVELNNGLLLADGRPLFPRVLEHRGEPLVWVRRIGFNAIRLAAPPTPELIAEAHQAGLWLIVPPPGRSTPLDPPPPPQAFAGFAAAPILAWDLGTGLTSRELEMTKRWAEALRRTPGGTRPLIGEADTELRVFSRYLDLLISRREPLGTSFELNDFGPWLRERPRLARPGTPGWSVVQTQLALETHEQCQLLGRGPGVSTCPLDQIRLLAYQAIAAGTRGLVFASRSRLDQDDPATRLRALGLELLNHELEWLEPWGATGSVVTTMPVSTPPLVNPLAPRPTGGRWLDPPPTGVPDVEAVLLQTERAKLVLPLWSGRGAQFVPGQLAASGVSVIVPGVPETNDVFRLTSSGLQPIRHQRVTGGMRLTFPEYGAATFALLTPDPTVVGGMMRRLLEVGPRIAELQRELTAIELQRTAETDGRLATQGRFIPHAGRWLTLAREELQQADARLGQRDFDGSVEHARRAQRPLNLLARAHWELALQSAPSAMTSPLLASYATLPEHWNFLSWLNQARWSRNQLPQGDFEDFEAVLNAGWRQFVHPLEGLNVGAELSTEVRDVRAGRHSLRLSVRPSTPEGETGLIETPPLWITSPGVPLAAGQWVRIVGWVYVPRSIKGSFDGLMIIDSLGGEALAERIGHSSAWRPFVLYRAAPRAGVVTVTFALTGIGEAWLDDVAIEPLASPPTVPGLETLSPPTGQPAGVLLVPPR